MNTKHKMQNTIPIIPMAPANRLRLLLVCHRYQMKSHYLSPLHEAFNRWFDLSRYYVEDGWPSSVEQFADYEQYDAIIWFVRFRELKKQGRFCWGRYQLHKIMYDHDAHLDFNRLAGSRYLGQWPEVFKTNEFQLMICTGSKTRDHLISQAVPAVWLPKAVDRDLFYDQGLPRSGFCIYGRIYHSRAAMVDYLQSHRIKIQSFSSPYDQLNQKLNHFLGSLVCNMEGVFPNPISKLWHRLQPRRGIQLKPGPELMLKNFEIAASGATCICDYLTEMDELGFVDGNTVVSYRSLAELAEKLHYFSNNPDELRRIGQSGATLCQHRHTWDHRMSELNDLLLSMN